MSIEQILNKFYSQNMKFWNNDKEAPLKEAKSSILKTILEALPEKKEYSKDVSSYYTDPEIENYNACLDDIRQRIERLFK